MCGSRIGLKSSVWLRRTVSETCTGEHFPKPGGRPLRPDAANDVYASFMIYRALQNKADQADFVLDPLSFCSHLGDSPLLATATVEAGKTGKPISPVIRAIPGGPTPSEGRALSLFMSELRTEEVARHLGLKQSTVQ